MINEHIKIYYENLDTYSIKTPLGVFNTVDDALNIYPSIKEHKNIQQCVTCGKYFVKVGRKNGPRKCCSDECSKINKKFTNRKAAYKYQKKKQKQKRDIINEHLINNGPLPDGFNQIDDPKKLGNTDLTKHISKTSNGEYDFDKEENIIKKELRRLGI